MLGDGVYSVCLWAAAADWLEWRVGGVWNEGSWCRPIREKSSHKRVCTCMCICECVCVTVRLSAVLGAADGREL